MARRRLGSEDKKGALRTILLLLHLKVYCLPKSLGRISNTTIETTNTYRDHLYITAATKIDASYNLLLRSLHNIDVNSFSDPHTLDSAPQPAERIKREMQYMSMPLGETILRFTRPLENGEKQQFEMKLSDRMALFEDRVQSQCEEVKALQRQWEEVVGEIWKCGVQILGKDIMDELLHSERRDERRNDSDLEGSTLFIPEQGDDEISWKSKSRGSFRDPIPEFLIQPSMMKGEDLSMPNIPMEQVKEMNKRIKSLGAVQIEELKKSHNDLENAYGKKVRQIQAICNADD